MTIEAPLSRYKKQNLLIITIVLFGAGLWFAYDAYKNLDFIAKHTIDGQPDDTLIWNKRLAPTCIIGSFLTIGYFFAVKGKKVIADDDKFTIGNTAIPYGAIEKIDKTHFDKKGFFKITYTENGQSKELTLKDRTYDNLPAVLDHIVSKIS